MSARARPVRLAVVIPTRNRGQMAAKSVESVLACDADGDRIAVIVSDNSTDPRESEVLEKSLADADARVTLIRPSAPLPMTAHWNFAIDHAMGVGGCTHFMFLTDRMLVRAHRMRQILGIIARFPDEVLSFSYDRIDDVRQPAVYRPLPRSGDLLRVESGSLLGMSARMAFPSCLPRMLNSVSPRRHIDALNARFGSAFSSLSPDFCFCYRTLDARESILVFDCSVLVTYGLDRSNGNSFARGVMTRDSNDYVSNVPLGRDSFRSPYPEFMTIGNGVLHEYLQVKLQSSSGKFPEIEIGGYRHMLATEVRRFEDKQLVKASLDKLRLRGWVDRGPSLASRWKTMMSNFLLGVLAQRFDSVQDAIAYAVLHEGPAWAWLPHPARKFGVKIMGEGALSKGCPG